MRVLAALGAAMLALIACGGGSTEETAPPPTPLPSLRTPTVSTGPTDSPDPGARLTPDPESAYQQLLASVPLELADRCTRGGRAGAAIARVECEPASGADRVSYLLYDDGATMTAAYRARLDRIAAADLEGPGCGKGPGTERLKNGRRACYADGGAASVMWTNDLVFVIADATRSDGDWAALERFWTDAGPVTP